MDQPAAFKLIEPEEPNAAKEKLPKKKPSEPSAILDEVLKQRQTIFEIPQQLPTVDFMDEPSSSKRHNKNKKNDRPVKDYTNEPVRKFEKPEPKKKVKNKFSKVSNPFPNDRAKNPTARPEATAINPETADPKVDEIPEPKEKKQKSPGKPQNLPKETSGSSNSSVFTVDSVDSLKIHAHSIKNMKEVLNFHKLTHVQQRSIPAALEGKDVLIRSPTGE